MQYLVFNIDEINENVVVARAVSLSSNDGEEETGENQTSTN